MIRTGTTQTSITISCTRRTEAGTNLGVVVLILRHMGETGLARPSEGFDSQICREDAHDHLRPFLSSHWIFEWRFFMIKCT